MPDETNDINNAISCCKEAVQFGASFAYITCLLDFDEICAMAMNLFFFHLHKTK